MQRDKLYLLSLNENANNICDENINDSLSVNVTKRRKRIDDVSSKLWHCRLGHISRGGIERLIKEYCCHPWMFISLDRVQHSC
jgi:hypothetical protein